MGAHLSTFAEEFASLGVQLDARYDDSPIVENDGTPPSDDPSCCTPRSSPGGRTLHLFFSGGSSLFDHMGWGFTLLHINGEQDFEEMKRSAEQRGIPLKILKIDEADARALYERDLALVRPDLHVAWRGNYLPNDCVDYWLVLPGGS